MISVKVNSILDIKKILGRGELQVGIPEGSTLESLLAILIETYGDGLASYLYGEGGNELLPHIRVMVNGRDIGFLKGLATVLKDSDEILILPPISGG